MVLNTRPLNIVHYTHRWCYKIHSSILASEMASISYLFFIMHSLSVSHRFKLEDRAGSGRGSIHLTRLFEALKQTVFSSKACGTVVNYTSSLNRWIIVRTRQ